MCSRAFPTPVLSVAECRRFLCSIPVGTIGVHRDHALIAPMLYSFARVSAAFAMNVRDVFLTDGSLWLRLNEKGGKVLEVACRHNLETYFKDYIVETGIAPDCYGPLFRSLNRDGLLSERRLVRRRTWEMLRQRAGLQEFRRMSATTASGPPESLRIWKVRRLGSKWLNTWPATRTPRRRSPMIGAPTASRWTTSRGSGFEGPK